MQVAQKVDVTWDGGEVLSVDLHTLHRIPVFSHCMDNVAAGDDPSIPCPTQHHVTPEVLSILVEILEGRYRAGAVVTDNNSLDLLVAGNALCMPLTCSVYREVEVHAVQSGCWMQGPAPSTLKSFVLTNGHLRVSSQAELERRKVWVFLASKLDLKYLLFAIFSIGGFGQMVSPLGTMCRMIQAGGTWATGPLYKWEEDVYPLISGCNDVADIAFTFLFRGKKVEVCARDESDLGGPLLQQRHLLLVANASHAFTLNQILQETRHSTSGEPLFKCEECRESVPKRVFQKLS